MVRAADDLKTQLRGADGVQVSLTGASGMWSDLNEANRSAMLKAEVISWPVTMIILVLAFGSLVAAGLPLMLTILGLVASAGSLYVGTQLLDAALVRLLLVPVLLRLMGRWADGRGGCPSPWAASCRACASDTPERTRRARATGSPR